MWRSVFLVLGTGSLVTVRVTVGLGLSASKSFIADCPQGISADWLDPCWLPDKKTNLNNFCIQFLLVKLEESDLRMHFRVFVHKSVVCCNF